MPARKSTSKSTVAPKRHRTSAAEASTAALVTVSFTAFKHISPTAIAATRIQKVWRSKFSLNLTRLLVAAYLKPNAGPTPQNVRMIR